MPAGVVKGTYLAVTIAYDEDRILTDLHGEVVTRTRHLAIVSDKQPVPIPELLQLNLVIRGARIEVARERRHRPVGLQAREHGLACIPHWKAPSRSTARTVS